LTQEEADAVRGMRDAHCSWACPTPGRSKFTASAWRFRIRQYSASASAVVRTSPALGWAIAQSSASSKLLLRRSCCRLHESSRARSRVAVDAAVPASASGALVPCTTCADARWGFGIEERRARKLLQSDPGRAEEATTAVQRVTPQALTEVRDAVQDYRRLAITDALDGARAAPSAAGIETVRRTAPPASRRPALRPCWPGPGRGDDERRPPRRRPPLRDTRSSTAHLSRPTEYSRST
jgi:hypothetical protein